MLERIQGLVGSPKGVWESRKRMCQIKTEFDWYMYLSVIHIVSFLLSILIEEDPACESRATL